MDNDDLKNVMDQMLARTREILLAMTQEQLLNDRWYFRFDDRESVAWNMYQFSDCLESYKRDCRKWEEHHNGSSCVVGRVRDKYILPKIKDFMEVLKEKM